MTREDDPPRRVRLATIGHSNRPFEAFVDALDAHGVDRVADVRTVPRSRTVPWSSRETLAPALERRGLAYRHDPALGGLRKPRPDSTNQAWRNAGFRGFADPMETEAFERGLEDLLAFGDGGFAAVMCAEAVPWRCHRSLIADALLAAGHEVIDIFDARSAKPHALASFARVVDGRVRY